MKKLHFSLVRSFFLFQLAWRVSTFLSTTSLLLLSLTWGAPATVQNSLLNYGKYLKRMKEDLILKCMTEHISNSLLSSHPAGEKNLNYIKNRKAIAQYYCRDRALWAFRLPKRMQTVKSKWETETQQQCACFVKTKISH